MPIHTKSDTSLEAREKALKIFETMNNRGMPLDDTDIFKKEVEKTIELLKYLKKELNKLRNEGN
ncbi:DUF262 domain-containing protein [Aliarcobacter butzleri]|uniref:DUF262 domain-containing protein n=1 Tax=Aliarcobacter butzleri TaxID=28197 RepID=UPI0021B2C304|nr:DUF262 domain-containing protein [Aliarcobacter butzleri]MCT7550937.1 DUF262 domain-containing protein [Aliarcobacter butzleri]MCT7559907.1 DUF262 domain-containing protein [Aliarcobacter butzleri]